jgi:two-component system, repressor protein LuxO
VLAEPMAAAVADLAPEPVWTSPVSVFEPLELPNPPAAPLVLAKIEVMPLAEMERRLVVAALRRTGNDVPRAAALLEINPSTIYRKLAAWRAEGSIPEI